MNLGCELHAGGGGGLGGEGFGAQLGKGFVALRLKGGELVGDGGLLLVGQTSGLIEVGQRVHRPVDGAGPVRGERAIAFNGHALAVFVLLVLGGGIGHIGGFGLSGGEFGRQRAQLVALVGVRGQHGIVGNEHTQRRVVHGDPLHGVGQAVLRGNREDVGFEVAGGADSGDVIVLHEVVHGVGVIEHDGGVHRHDVALGVHVGDRVVGYGGLVLGRFGVKEPERVHHAASGALVGVVGGHIVDGVGFLVAHVGAGLFRHGDDVLGGDDVFRVVQIDQADDGHVRLGEGHRGRQLQRHILGAGGVFNIPGFLVVGDENTGAARAARRVVDAQKQLDRFLRRGRFAEQHGGDFGFLDAGVQIGIGLADRACAADGFGGAHGHAHLVGAARLIGRVGVGSAAVRALVIDRRAVVIAEGGVAVAVLFEGVGKAIAAGVFLSGRVLSGGTYVKELVVAVGNILGTGEHRCSVRSQVGADVNRRARHGADGGQAQNQSDHRGYQLFHFRVQHVCVLPLVDGRIIMQVYALVKGFCAYLFC